MFVGEARISDVIASRRLASDWLGDDITWRCIGGGGVTMAQARHSKLEEDARLSTLPFSPPHSGSSDSVTFDPPRAFSTSLAPSYPRSRRLGRSRSASLSPLSLFSRFSQPPPALPLPAFLFSPPSLEIFLVSAARTSGVRRLPRFCTRLSTRRLFRGSVSATSSPCSRFSPAAEMPLSLHFHLTIILVLQILLAPLALSGETSVPARLIKFHYEINPGEYSYSERSSRFYYYLSLSFIAQSPSPLVPVSNFITNCNKYHYARPSFRVWNFYCCF